MTSSEFYRRAEIEVKEKWGTDVHLLLINLSSDKTHVTRTGSIKVWPLYCTIANLSLQKLRSPKGSEILGYCPQCPYSSAEISKIMKECDTTADYASHTKMIKRYLEKSFFDTVEEPIKAMETTGPVVLQYGRGKESVKKRTICKIGLYICK